MFESLITRKGPYFLFTDKNICDSLHITLDCSRIQNMDPRVLFTSNTWLQLLFNMHLYPEFEKTCFGQPSFESLTPESMPFIDAPS